MPNRVLREAILTSDRVDQLTAETEVFYRRLLSVVDDFACHDARPSVLISRCYALRTDRVPIATMVKMVVDCVQNDLIALYKSDASGPAVALAVEEYQEHAGDKGCKHYLFVYRFNQSCRASKRKWPAPPVEIDDTLPRSTCEADAAQMHLISTAPATQLRPEAVIGTEVGDRRRDISTGKREDPVPPIDLPGQRPAHPAGKEKSFYPGPRTDYTTVQLPTIFIAEDIYAIEDPVVAAMAVTRETDKQSWGHWRKWMGKATEKFEYPVAAKSFVDAVATLWSEMKVDDIRKPGAVLNNKLELILDIKSAA